MVFRRLLSRLGGNNNPTVEWFEDHSRPLEIDFAIPSLGGVTFDQPIDALSWLGPAAEADSSALRFYAKGLTVFLVNGQHDAWCVEFREHNGYEPFCGMCLWDGRQVTLSASSTPEETVAQLGEASQCDHDDAGNIEMLHYGSVEFEFADDLEGERTLSAVVCMASS